MLTVCWGLWWVINRLPMQDTTNLVCFWGIILLLGLYYGFSFSLGMEDWRQASTAVDSRMWEFQYLCGKFNRGREISRSIPESRIGRAWVFQVGYEQGANVYCDKDLKIFTQ
jgi:hypothetical protein